MGRLVVNRRIMESLIIAPKENLVERTIGGVEYYKEGKDINNEDIVIITVLEVSGERVKLAITAPDHIGIIRTEIVWKEQIHNEYEYPY